MLNSTRNDDDPVQIVTQILDAHARQLQWTDEQTALLDRQVRVV